MAPNAELIERFYAAFAARDGDAMAACYAPDARFSDPVFTDLRGSEPGAMWRMLTGRATDLEVELVASGVSEGEGAVDGTASGAGESYGTARWIARYTFTQTGRPVVNDVRASFRFADGLIAEHADDFSFHRWARQALGAQGLLLGWTPIVRSAVRRRARAGLEEFIAADRAPGSDAPGGAAPGAGAGPEQ